MYNFDQILMNTNTTIHAFNSFTGKYEKTFANYAELRREWPGAEIVNIEYDEGVWFVFC